MQQTAYATHKETKLQVDDTEVPEFIAVKKGPPPVSESGTFTGTFSRPSAKPAAELAPSKSMAQTAKERLEEESERLRLDAESKRAARLEADSDVVV